MGLKSTNKNVISNQDSRIAAALEEAISDDDSFTSCAEQETDDEGNDSRFNTLTSFEVIQPTQIARDSRDAQLERDIQMLSQAIAQYGKSESDKTKAHTLLKSILLLYFGDVSYRDKTDGNFHPWRELKDYSALESFPIAAVLLHGSRALIEFPSEVSTQLIEWLLPDQTSWRYTATHGIETVDEGENAPLTDKPPKHLKEIKVAPYQALGHVISQALGGTASPHYGIDIALGGTENRNKFSKNIIQANGEHGNLYVNYYASKEGEHGGLLLGIEQSAPGKNDQYGGAHDLVTSPKKYSASGGDFFCKEGALENLPIDHYYDSLWNFISKQNFDLIQEAYDNVCVLLDLLQLDPRTKDESIHFIKEIVSSSGRGNEQAIYAICNKYFLKTNLYQSMQADVNTHLSRIKKEAELSNKSLQTYFNAQLQSQTQSFAERSQCIKESLQRLSAENASLRQQIMQYKALESQREAQVARENKTATLKDLQSLSSTLMQNVESKMGWFSKSSIKKTIFTQLIKKLQGAKENELSEEKIVWLLKNFISVAIMNRYDKKGRETHSGKACLSLLNDPNYKPLKTLLFPKKASLVREDLLSLSTNDDPLLLASARYQQSLYNAFGITKTDKNIPNDQLDSVMSEFVYKP